MVKDDEVMFSDEVNFDSEIETLVSSLVNEERQSDSSLVSNDNDSLHNSSIEKIVIKRKVHSRKPPTNPAYIPAIRIFRRDIRRKYLEMLSNVMNSHDEHLLTSFLYEYFSPNCLLADIYTDATSSQLNDITVMGISTMKSFFALNYYLMPDAVIQISNTRVCKRIYETGSRVLANIKFEATILYAPKNYWAVLEGIKNQQYDQLKTQEIIEKHDLILASEPKKTMMNGTIIVVLDELHRFTRLEFRGTGTSNPWISFSS